MPTAPISMRKLKEILRLKYGAGLSHRQIGRSLAISPPLYPGMLIGRLSLVLSSGRCPQNGMIQY